ncbi:MAG: type II/IV secretion system protein, partial [Planctomycetota bacterium]
MSPTAAAAVSRRLGSLLVERGYLSDEGLRSALVRQQDQGRNKLLGELLVEMELCTEDQVTECLAVEY